METQFLTGDVGASPYVSTGRLPTSEQVAALVTEAHARFKSNRDGENSQIYPALAGVSKELFGICVVGDIDRLEEACASTRGLRSA